jgi:hypothetical protein
LSDAVATGSSAIPASSFNITPKAKSPHAANAGVRAGYKICRESLVQTPTSGTPACAQQQQLQQQLISQAQRSRYIPRLYREVVDPSIRQDKYLCILGAKQKAQPIKSAGPEGKFGT